MIAMQSFILLFILLGRGLGEAAQHGHERFLTKFLRNAAARINPCEVGDHLDLDVEVISKEFLKETEGRNGEKLLKELRQATRIEELLSAKNSISTIETQSAKSKSRVKAKKPSLALVLEDDDVDENNPFILQAKHLVNFEKLKNDVTGQLKRMPKYEQSFLLNVSTEVLAREDQHEHISLSYESVIMNRSGNQLAPIPRARVIARWVGSVFKFGFNILEKAFESSEFLERLPFIGNEVIKLRSQGKPFFEVIDYLRHTSVYLKLAVFTPGDLQDIDSRTVTKAKQVLSNLAANSIKTIVLKSLGKTAHEEVVQEYLTRIFYFFLSSIISRATPCKVSHLKDARVLPDVQSRPNK